jgi:ribosomal protein S18 acetylase RimI-like enzyme
MIALRPMTQEEYDPYIRFLREDYAKERAGSSDTPLEEERIESGRQIDSLLPDGLHSAGHHLWIVVEVDGGAVVGTLWVFVDGGKKRAFIYDIAIQEAQRGKGYGRRTLELLEDELRPLGVSRIALNVFAQNIVARGLYEKQGYYAVATSMQKAI